MTEGYGYTGEPIDNMIKPEPPEYKTPEGDVLKGFSLIDLEQLNGNIKTNNSLLREQITSLDKKNVIDEHRNTIEIIKYVVIFLMIAGLFFYIHH